MRSELLSQCVNFRDIGEFINYIAGQELLPVQRLYRGGRLDAIEAPAVIDSAGTIINLRNSQDPQTFGAVMLHFPISNDYEKYETQRPEVKQWLTKVLRVFENPALAYPVFLHCTAGKDRTGVVVAALLRILEVPEPVIIEEYLLSTGDVQETRIRQALNGIGEPIRYFKSINLQKIRDHILVR